MLSPALNKLTAEKNRRLFYDFLTNRSSFSLYRLLFESVRASINGKIGHLKIASFFQPSQYSLAVIKFVRNNRKSFLF